MDYRITLRLILLVVIKAKMQNVRGEHSDGITKQPEKFNIPVSSRLTYKTDDAVKLFGEGLKSASNKLGLMTNQGLPNMVLKTLNSLTSIPINNINSDFLRSNIFNGFFRLLGFDTEKLQAIALNAIVFIAQMIGSNLTKRHIKKENISKNYENDYDDDDEDDDNENKEEIKSGTPLEWVLRNAPENVRELIVETQESNLPNKLSETLQNHLNSRDRQGFCLQQLICRLEPVIKGMQKNTKQLFSNENVLSEEDRVTHKHWSKMLPSERLYAYIPNNNEFVTQKNYCEKKLPPCVKR